MNSNNPLIFLSFQRQFSPIIYLFDYEKDPINLIKWKEVYEELERSIDTCEDVANVIESVMLKNA